MSDKAVDGWFAAQARAPYPAAMIAPRLLTQNYLATQVDDELVLLGLESGELFSIEGTAKAVWDQIDGKRDVAAIIAGCARAFGEDEAVIAPQVHSFLRDLGKAKLVSVES